MGNLPLMKDNSLIGKWSLDMMDNKYIYISKGMETITGYPQERLYNFSWDTLIHPDDFMEYQEKQCQLVNGVLLKRKYRIIHRYGAVVEVLDLTKPVLDSKGKLIRIEVNIIDITKVEVRM